MRPKKFHISFDKLFLQVSYKSKRVLISVATRTITWVFRSLILTIYDPTHRFFLINGSFWSGYDRLCEFINFETIRWLSLEKDVGKICFIIKHTNYTNVSSLLDYVGRESLNRFVKSTISEIIFWGRNYSMTKEAFCERIHFLHSYFHRWVMGVKLEEILWWTFQPN